MPPEVLLTKLLDAVGKEAEEEIVSVADQLHERGRLQGLAEGERKGQQSTLLRLLRTRFGELPADVMARVRSADAAQLELWTDRVLTAPTLAAVLGGV